MSTIVLDFEIKPLHLSPSWLTNSHGNGLDGKENKCTEKEKKRSEIIHKEMNKWQIATNCVPLLPGDLCKIVLCSSNPISWFSFCRNVLLLALKQCWFFSASLCDKDSHPGTGFSFDGQQEKGGSAARRRKCPR